MTQLILLVMALITVLGVVISFYFNNWITKFVFLAMFVCLANAVYFSLDGVKGWPAEEPNEVKGTLASVVIVNPSENTEGAIYVGIFLEDNRKWYEYDYPRFAPKTFYVKYSNDRAAEFEKAKQAMEEGKEVRINGIPPENIKGGDSEEAMTGMETLSGIISQYLDKIIPKQGDTYKPEAPDVQIMEAEVPPEKGKTK